MIEDIIIVLICFGVFIAGFIKKHCRVVERPDQDNGIEDLLIDLFLEDEIQ